MATYRECVFLLTISIALASSESLEIQIIGIYSECQNRGENITELSKYARRAKFEIDYFTQEKIPSAIPKEYNSSLIIQTRHFDVCENISLLLATVENLTLDTEYFFQEPNKTSMTSSIGIILTYAQTEMMNVFSSLVHGLPIIHLYLNDEFIEREVKVSADILLTVYRHLYGKSKVMLLTLNNNDTNLRAKIYNESVKIFRQHNICVFTQSLNTTSSIMNDKINSWLIENKPNIILYGKRDDQLNFLRKNEEFINNLGIHVIIQSTRDYFKKMNF